MAKDLCVTTCAAGTGKLTCTVTYSGVPPFYSAGLTLCVMVSQFTGAEADKGIDFTLCMEHSRRSIVFLSLSFVKNQ